MRIPVLVPMAAAVCLLAVPAVVLTEDGSGAREARTRPAPDLERGRNLFEKRCASCHGDWGEGNGPSASALEHPPRNLAQGPYELKSTERGAPTAEDLFRTISQGIPASGMPPFGHLPEAERWQIVYYVQSLMGPRGQAHGPVLHVPTAPPRTEALVARGRELYVTAGCVKCHGPEGRGRGPAAGHLKDDTGRAVRPHDMERAWTLKSGRSAEDLYRAIQIGLTGTPMPSYSGRLSPEETWAVVYYIQSLEKDAGGQGARP